MATTFLFCWINHEETVLKNSFCFIDNDEDDDEEEKVIPCEKKDESTLFFMRNMTGLNVLHFIGIQHSPAES